MKAYLSLIKFSHTVFALPFAMIGAVLGFKDGYPLPVTLFFKIILCMIFARSAAMAFNRWADARFDVLNPRTAVREIPAGVISSRSAVLFVLVSCYYHLFYQSNLFLPLSGCLIDDFRL